MVKEREEGKLFHSGQGQNLDLVDSIEMPFVFGVNGESFMACGAGNEGITQTNPISRIFEVAVHFR
jgi:hypothetical protein